jgi:hypothetical protein
MCYVAAPIPFNWILGFFRKIWQRIRAGTKYDYLTKVYAEGYKAGMDQVTNHLGFKNSKQMDKLVSNQEKITKIIESWFVIKGENKK